MSLLFNFLLKYHDSGTNDSANLLQWYSDKFPVQKGRARFIFVPQCFILAGFTIALIGAAMGNMHKVVYAGMFIATCGTLPAFPGNITWLSNNLSGSYKRSAGMAIQIGVGNMGGIFVSNFYREGDAPKYMLGHALQIGVVVVGMVAVIVLRVGYAKANKERDEMGVDRSLSLSQMSQVCLSAFSVSKCRKYELIIANTDGRSCADFSLLPLDFDPRAIRSWWSIVTFNMAKWAPGNSGFLRGQQRRPELGANDGRRKIFFLYFTLLSLFAAWNGASDCFDTGNISFVMFLREDGRALLWVCIDKITFIRK